MEDQPKTKKVSLTNKLFNQSAWQTDAKENCIFLLIHLVVSLAFAKYQSHLRPLGLSGYWEEKSQVNGGKRNHLLGLTFYYLTHFQLILSICFHFTFESIWNF